MIFRLKRISKHLSFLLRAGIIVFVVFCGLIRSIYGRNGKMKKKIGKMNEAAWVMGIILCNLGVALDIKADFGVSMIAAPAVIIQKWLSGFFGWFTNGMSEYLVQAIILIILCIAVRRFRIKYVLSFGAAVISGAVLDLWLTILGGNGAWDALWVRIVLFAVGAVTTAFAIALFFRTNLPIQIYELFVVELADRYSLNKNKVKLFFDIIMFALSCVLSLVLTGGFNGFGIGTVIITFINAPLIAFFGRILDRFFEFDSVFSKKEKN